MYKQQRPQSSRPLNSEHHDGNNNIGEFSANRDHNIGTEALKDSIHRSIFENYSHLPVHVSAGSNTKDMDGDFNGLGEWPSSTEDILTTQHPDQGNEVSFAYLEHGKNSPFNKYGYNGFGELPSGTQDVLLTPRPDNGNIPIYGYVTPGHNVHFNGQGDNGFGEAVNPHEELVRPQQSDQGNNISLAEVEHGKNSPFNKYGYNGYGEMPSQTEDIVLPPQLDNSNNPDYAHATPGHKGHFDRLDVNAVDASAKPREGSTLPQHAEQERGDDVRVASVEHSHNNANAYGFNGFGELPSRHEDVIGTQYPDNHNGLQSGPNARPSHTQVPLSKHGRGIDETPRTDHQEGKGGFTPASESKLVIARGADTPHAPAAKSYNPVPVHEKPVQPSFEVGIKQANTDMREVNDYLYTFPTDIHEFGRKPYEESSQQFQQDERNFQKAETTLQPDNAQSIAHLHASETKLHDDAQYLCFCTGTMISTTQGEKAVEALKVGDVAVTATGEQRPIAWIGHQDVIINERQAQPICIKVHAIADGVPYVDLYTSPAHGFAFKASAQGLLGRSVKDIFIRASALVNGETIVRAPVRRATYWHVELAGSHAVLRANGAAAESFIDHGERHFFTNATSRRSSSVQKDCLPRKRSGKYVRDVKSRINRRIETCVLKNYYDRRRFS